MSLAKWIARFNINKVLKRIKIEMIINFKDNLWKNQHTNCIEEKSR